MSNICFIVIKLEELSESYDAEINLSLLKQHVLQPLQENSIHVADLIDAAHGYGYGNEFLLTIDMQNNCVQDIQNEMILIRRKCQFIKDITLFPIV